jgi:hypothetical protein
MAAGTAIAGGSFFDLKPTELESRNALRDIQAVRETPDVRIARPNVYTQPPLIVEGTVNGVPDAKLYYFTRYQSVDMLLNLFNEQFLNLYDGKFIRPLYGNDGVPLPTIPYTADKNPSTHQLVISCPSVEYAQQVLEFFQEVDVLPIQVRIDCLISEVYADRTLDWDTRMAVQNLFGADVELVGKLPGAAMRDAARSGFGLKGGYVEGGTYDLAGDTFNVTDEGHLFGALIDVLTSRGYLKILMNPSLEVVTGQTAKIKTEEIVKIDRITIEGYLDRPVYTPVRAKIVDSLEITPHVFADGMIGLKTVAVIGSKATPEGVAQIPIKTERRITIDENRIRQGQSMIIGGIRKAEQRSVVRGVPFLKDIPLLGVLFSSKDFEERAKEILFIITPTISTGGVPNKDIIADIRRKHDRVKSSDFMENIKDPLGSGAYTELVEEEAIHAELGRVRARMEKASADRKAEELTKQIAIATRQLEDESKQAQRALAAAKDETAIANTLAETSKTQLTTAQSQAAELQKQLEAQQSAVAKATANLAAAQAAADKAKADADKAKAAAAAAQAAADKANKEAEATINEWMKKKQQPAKSDGEKSDSPRSIKSDDAP